MRRDWIKRALPLFVVGIAQLAILLGAALHDSKPLTPAQKRAKRANVGSPFPLELRSPQVVAGTSVRVLVALRRPSLADLNAKTPQSPLRQRAYVRSLHHEARALMSALTAKGVVFGHPILFARVWSGFAATIATKDLPAVQTLGLRVEPVSRFYPAQVPSKASDAPPVRRLPTTAAAVGRVAVLDAFPRGVKRRADEVGVEGTRKRSPFERAGLRIAAVVHDELPSARVDRFRVAGLQALETGRFEVFATTDQLMAGLERAVDPDQNGDAVDAYRVIVTGLSAPYSGFDRSPAAEAVDGATELGSLVVAPAGNGGQPDGPFGSIGAPAAAHGALTVGALDGTGKPTNASSAGPTYGLWPKPDLAISGGARTHAGSAWGTAIAAARVTGVAAALRSERPRLTPAEAAAALVGTAAPRGEPLLAGGGDPLLQAARAASFVAVPAQVALRPGATTTVTLHLLGQVPALHAAPVKGLHLQVNASGRSSTVGISADPDAKPGSGRIDMGQIAIPYEILGAPPAAPPLGRPRVILRAGKPDGVRFTAGSLKRGDKGTSVIPVGNLILSIDGPTQRELTPPGGALDLLPGEYAYTLTAEVKAELAPGRYRFALRARGTAGGTTSVRRSRSFRVR